MQMWTVMTPGGDQQWRGQAQSWKQAAVIAVWVLTPAPGTVLMIGAANGLLNHQVVVPNVNQLQRG